jgi:hypothetical protein
MAIIGDERRDTHTHTHTHTHTNAGGTRGLRRLALTRQLKLLGWTSLYSGALSGSVETRLANNGVIR